MTFRTQEVIDGIEADMRAQDVARLFAACCSRLASDGRATFELFQSELETLDTGEKSEVEEWFDELFPKEE